MKNEEEYKRECLAKTVLSWPLEKQKMFFNRFAEKHNKEVVDDLKKRFMRLLNERREEND